MDKFSRIFERFLNAGKDALISILQEIQREQGYLTQEAVNEVAVYLQIPTSRIYSIATFYDQFRFSPQGKNHVRVCNGTACHVMGSGKVLSEIVKELKISAGETSRDGSFSLETVQCMGACSLSPVVETGGDYHGNVNPEKMRTIIDQLRNQED
ncbi:MAG: NADH-quinone oxidoreductase subunit NuoE [Bacteroidales bacterium]|jgi:NADH-quinone oxidoreductase subunit E|nr:NADH-quinone oxidoreductase subunit NuoE [Bacteroidales bacterium]